MAYQLPVDCLNEIFEYLEEDKPSLHSCLLVNRLWCKISVRILWRNIWNSSHILRNRRLLSTLIACLPNESKELLFENVIFISTPTSKPPLFNYASFCKVLLIYKIVYMINIVLREISERRLVANEVVKMFTNQSSLKKLNYNYNPNVTNFHYNISITYFSGMKDLLELC